MSTPLATILSDLNLPKMLTPDWGLHFAMQFTKEIRRKCKKCDMNKTSDWIAAKLIISCMRLGCFKFYKLHETGLL